ncbi:hypothetical protein AB2L57_10700 [Microbacterium sp. HA-8]|uniref:hypothetical protein n=1 Tax=Microbacterium sp. HA-8 TaxID=3234200 RepID=UPI0038F7F91F
MYDPSLEASYDDLLNASWSRAGSLIAQLLAQAGPEALEGGARAAFVARAHTLLRPVAGDTVAKSRSHATRQLVAMGLLAPGTPDLAALALTELDVHSMMNAAVRYYYATANVKDYGKADVQRDAFSYAVQLMDKGVRTSLSDRRLDASSRTYAAGGVTLFERYLGSGDSCDRCKEIAGAIVTRKDVKPIHDACNCGVRPVKR